MVIEVEEKDGEENGGYNKRGKRDRRGDVKNEKGRKMRKTIEP